MTGHVTKNFMTGHFDINKERAMDQLSIAAAPAKRYNTCMQPHDYEEYEVLQDASVVEAEERWSDEVARLTTGQRIIVVETRGQRLRVLHPKGWVAEIAASNDKPNVKKVRFRLNVALG